MKPILYIITNNHFDPTWRRCWQRRFEFKGQTFVSYADIQEYYMLDNLAIARQNPAYKFEAETPHVVQSFLQRHPEALGELQALSCAGRFAVSGSGYLIVDGNMIQGESLVRNLLNGLLWVEETFDQPTRLAVRNDAFGNPAQLPQILRGCELDCASGLVYTYPEGRYWRGLDGSVVFLPHMTAVAHLPQGVVKYRPCPACRGRGEGCPDCAGRGIDTRGQPTLLPDEVDRLALESEGAGVFLMTPEELLPNPEIIAWAEGLRADYNVRFALAGELLAHSRAELAALDNPPADELHPGVELNPNNSGVWVTRIRTKQNVRRQEFALYAAEWLAQLADLQGQPYPRDDFEKVWKKLFFTMFHDAITATHVDPSHAELQEIYAEIEVGTATLRDRALQALIRTAEDEVAVLNPSPHPSTQVASLTLPGERPDLGLTDAHGQAVPVLAVSAPGGSTKIRFLAEGVPGRGTAAYRLARRAPDPLKPLAANILENQRYRVEFDANGLLAVQDKALNRMILEAGEYRPGELIIEHDEGSPWATLHPDQSRTPLSEHTRLLCAEGNRAMQRVVFAVEAPWRAGFVNNGFRARLSLSLVQGLDRLDFTLHVDWDTFNHRLRAAFPLPDCGRHIYEVPFGMLERPPYQPWFGWAAANGDWPASNWAGVEAEGMSVALFNAGTPSYKIETHPQGEVILLSLLRSPAVPTYLHEPENYTMTDYDGMRDAGPHDFDFAVASYNQPFAASPVVPEAHNYNAGLLAVAGRADLPEQPVVESRCACLAASKPAERGDALILRLVEFRGEGGAVEVRLPANVRAVAQTNLLERQPRPLEIKAGKVRLNLRAWEIATLRLEISR